MKRQLYTSISILVGVVVTAAIGVTTHGAEALAQGTPSPGPHLEKRVDPAGQAGTNAGLLGALLGRLAETKDAEEAKILADAVWKAWLRSGSPTIDLLMKQADDAVKTKELDIALKILDAVVDIAPEFSEGWNRRATVLYLKNDYRRSALDIRKVLELEPRHFGALTGLGMIMRELGDERGALAAFREALKYHPFLPGAFEAEKDLRESVEGRGI